MDRIDMTLKIPIRRISVATNADNRVTEQEGYDILYKAEIDMYTKRKHELEDNMNKTYSLIYLYNIAIRLYKTGYRHILISKPRLRMI
jgi:hypothetical protein